MHGVFLQFDRSHLKLNQLHYPVSRTIYTIRYTGSGAFGRTMWSDILLRSTRGLGITSGI